LLRVVFGAILLLSVSTGAPGIFQAGAEIPEGQQSEQTPVTEEERENRPWWKWLLFPFRPDGAKVTTDPCELGDGACLPPDEGNPPEWANDSDDDAPSFFFGPEPLPSRAGPSGPEYEDEMVLVRTRADFWGPISHRWLEMDTSEGTRTIGFGPATIPFIDTGQIGIGDEFDNEQRISGTHVVPFLTLPAVNWNYGREVGSGREVGEPFLVPRERVDELIAQESQKKNVFMYIPLFNDCRTYICTQKAKLQGKSRIWCYLLFKGYW